MKGIITSVLLAGCIICSASCKKELGYTGFESDRNETFTGEVVLSTDKAIYSPGESVTLTASTVPVGKIYIRYRHLGETVKEEAASSATWTWQTPAEDYMGYMVEMYQITDDGEEVILGTVGVDVSSDWSMFPRYGFLASFDVMTEDETNAIIDNLNRYHINGVQFQDWHYKHHWPLAGTAEKPMETYIDIASRNTSLTTIKNYISRIHHYGMKAIFYNLCFGALDDAADDGVKEEWYLFKDRDHNTKDFHPLGAPFKSSIYIVDPGNPEWLEYLGKRNDDVYAVLDFDGYQIDQLGNRGTLYNYNGEATYLNGRYASFINAMKEKHPSKDLIMNAVSGYGDAEILETGKMAFAYNEMWASEARFNDLYNTIKRNYELSDGEARTVFAAYMNYDKANSTGSFNTPGVLLTNAFMFALGGSHLELGEHMLCKEYFPNDNLAMPQELSETLVKYYDFMVAYQNLLRGEGEFNTVNVSSVAGNANFAIDNMQRGSISVFGRKSGKYQTVQLVNFTNADSDSWRDLNGTMPEPELIESLAVDIPVTGTVKRIWMASPDIEGGALQELNYSAGADKVRLSIPSLKYWDMIVIEYE